MTKNKRLTLSLLVAVIVGFAGATPVGSAHRECTEHASGHGSYIAGTDEKGRPLRRQFSFNAVEHRDGTVTGNAVIHNPAVEFRGHLEVSCLRVTPVDLNNDGTIDATRADIGGTVRDTNDPSRDGQNGFFTVFDFGEPGAGADTISPVFFSPPDQSPTSACQFILGDATAPSNIIQLPIDAGNIQARDCPGNDL